MPKIKLSEEKELYAKIVVNIKMLPAQKGEKNSVSQISRRVGIPRSTLDYKMSNPEKFTLQDLYKIANGYNSQLIDIIS